MSLCYKKVCFRLAIHSPAISILLLYEQKCITRNIMENSRVYCLINVCSYFVIILKDYFFNTSMNRKGLGYGVAKGYFTIVKVHSYEIYHHEHAAEPTGCKYGRRGRLGRCNFKFPWSCQPA